MKYLIMYLLNITQSMKVVLAILIFFSHSPSPITTEICFKNEISSIYAVYFECKFLRRLKVCINKVPILIHGIFPYTHV